MARIARVVVLDILHHRLTNKANKKSGIDYQVSTAEKIFLGNQEIDTITVAQALHWFRIETFFKEVDRVKK